MGYYIMLSVMAFMIYITGDKHANFDEVFSFFFRYKTTLYDFFIILGYTGINYFANEKDNYLKNSLLQLPIKLFCIHGNHEERPENIVSYKTKIYHDGIVFYEDNYPNILFAKDGEIYNFNHKSVLVIGGAYSVDKYFRLSHGYRWYESEQPSNETKEKILSVVDKVKKVDVVLSHTCPFRYIPREMFLASIDQSTVDNSMEEYLDVICEKLQYKMWYCGHYHTDKRVDNVRFLYHDIIEFC